MRRGPSMFQSPDKRSLTADLQGLSGAKLGIGCMDAGIYVRRLIDEVAADRVAYALVVAYSVIALLYVVLVGRFDAPTARYMFMVYLEVSLLGYCVTFPMLLLIATTALVVHRVPRRRGL